MPEIFNPGNEPLHPNSHLNVDSMLIPSFRVTLATQNGVQDKLLISVGGGLGDVICAEPAIRWAVNRFGIQVSVVSDYPDLFRHLKLHENIDGKRAIPSVSKYWCVDSLYTGDSLRGEFIVPQFTHVVDYFTVGMFRQQIPNAHKNIQLEPSSDCVFKMRDLRTDKDVIIHPGKTWPSRTVPARFWNAVMSRIKDMGFRPVLIGKKTGKFTTVDGLETDGVLDLREKLKLMETVSLLQQSNVLLTNDSSPLHMAASGNCWIGYAATAKHPEFTTHYRNEGEFGWRMLNFAKGGAWEKFPLCPNTKQNTRFDECLPEEMDSWMPDPSELAEWAVGRVGLH